MPIVLFAFQMRLMKIRIFNRMLRKNMGQPLEKYKEVDIYENDIPAKKETKI